MALLPGKLAIVTGASSGIGLATARVLAAEGAKVFVTGRNEEALKALATEIDAGYLASDLTVAGECAKVVAAAMGHLGGLTTLVNCAGVLQGGAMGQATLANFDFNFSINARAPFEMMTLAIPHLKKGAGPAIVNISSVNGKQSFAGTATYCGSKAAIDQMTRCAALDLAEFGVRANVVNPGVVVTPLQQRGGMDDEAYAKFIDRSVNFTHPLGKSRGSVAQPGEVGDLVAFLASDKAGFITGECIAIDGGRQCLGAR